MIFFLFSWPPVWLQVHSTEVGYYLRPAAIISFCSSSNNYHQFIHIRATTQCPHRYPTIYIYIVLCLHHFPLPLQSISSVATISKSPKQVLLKTDPTVSLPLFPTASALILSALLLSLFLSSIGCLHMSVFFRLNYRHFRPRQKTCVSSAAPLSVLLSEPPTVIISQSSQNLYLLL